MSHDDDLNPVPEGKLTLRLIAQSSDSNTHGDIPAGWVVAQMDQAAESVASNIANGRVANVALESVVFLSPIRVGAEVSIHTKLVDIGTSSVKIGVEVWTINPNDSKYRKVVDAIFVYVAIDATGRIRRVPKA